MQYANRKRGFTLIELIIVVVLTGILSVLLFSILEGPAKAYNDIRSRAELIDLATTVLQRMSREIRLAVPNSVRLDGTTAIEFIRTVDGGRYRRYGDGTNTDYCNTDPSDNDLLKINKDINCFEVIGELDNLPATLLTGNTINACRNQSALCLIIYNTGQLGANAYALDNIAPISEISSQRIVYSHDSSSFKFPNESPQQRFQIADTPVSFICSSNEIRRYDNYQLDAAQSNPPSGGNDNLLINNVDACEFIYDAGSSSRAGLVSISLTIKDPTTSESIYLQQQAHVDNQP